MRPGGREALWELVAWHLAAQARHERSARYAGLTASVLLIPLAIASLLSKHNQNPVWPVFLGLALLTPLLSFLQWSVTRRKLLRLYDGAEELRGYMRNVIFDYEIWRELMEDEAGHEIRLGPLELATVELSFADRVKGLFRDYPKLAEKKYLEPFPGWYRKLYRSGSQRDNQYVDHFWQYALAQLLNEEFFGNAPSAVS